MSAPAEPSKVSDDVRLGDYWAPGYYSKEDKEAMRAAREAGDPAWWRRRSDAQTVNGDA